MNNTRWIIFAAACAALIGLLIFTRDSSVAFEGDPATVVQDDRVYGDPDANVVLVEYGDFQCPGCGALAPVLGEVKQDYEDRIALVYRYLPLTNIHPNAKAAAAAAEAAAQQGKFWEMHDALYANQAEWSSAQATNRTSFFEKYAEQIGLDMEQYRADVGSDAVNERIGRGMAAARKAGIQLSTPVLVLNGEQLPLGDIQTDGQYDPEKLRNVLDEALRNAGEEPPEAKPEEAAGQQ